MKDTIGFIGLGIMGLPMARNLLRTGRRMVVFDLRREPMEQLEKEGAMVGSSPKDVATKAEKIITMLPDSREVEEVVLGENGLIFGVRPGTVFIDMSSINPQVTKRIADALREKGVAMLDAPVSGGETGAIHGTLAIMVGGDEEVFKDCLPLLSVLGKSVTRVGSVGAGGIAKLVNQIIVAINIAAVGEAFSLGVKAGLDPELLFAAIRGGLAGSMVLDSKIPMVMARNFNPGFKLRLHHKDLSNALSCAKDLSVPLPLTAAVQQILVSLCGQGMDNMDHAAIVRFFEQLASVEIRSRISSSGAQETTLG